jgi:hypothetical protein
MESNVKSYVNLEEGLDSELLTLWTLSFVLNSKYVTLISMCLN